MLIVWSCLASGGVSFPCVLAAPADAAAAVEIAPAEPADESGATAGSVDPLGESGADCLACCDQTSRPRDNFRTLSNSLLTAGTAAGGLAVVGLLIKRRRKG